MSMYGGRLEFLRYLNKKGKKKAKKSPPKRRKIVKVRD